MIFLRAKRSCLIEYESVEHATNAKDLMNSKILMGNAIRIFYSNYEEINLEQIEYMSEDVFIGGEETFRFKKNKHLSVNPPSQTLHVSNLKQESCNERIIRAFFSTHGVVEGVKFISQAKKNMCLVKFATVEQAVDALMLRHGIEVLGRKV
jgi:RNA recognition motif-containing protein